MKYTTNQIIEKFKLIHGDKYDYSKFDYLGYRQKSIIICKTHGEFLQHSNSHLSGQGCRKCFNDKNTLNFISAGWKRNINKRSVNFIIDCQLKNPDLDFSKTVYNGKKNKVIVTCKVHGDYSTTTRLLLQGVSCKKCFYENLQERWSKDGWINYCKNNSIDFPYFYILEFCSETERFIKFGITSKSLKTRINKYPSRYKITVIKSISSSPENVWNLENYLKTKYKQYKYKPSLKFGGSSQECLNFNSLTIILNDTTMCDNGHTKQK